MPVINRSKINSVKTMLLCYFSDNRPITREMLYAKVDEDIVAIAIEEGLIHIIDSRYKITAKGREYRDS